MTNYVVTFTIEVQVEAEGEDDAVELARLELPSHITSPAYKLNPVVEVS